MSKTIEVIGVDHGWSGMKTSNYVFTTGVKEITTEPAFLENVVKYQDTYYRVGGKRLEVRDLKVENDNFYILTLAAVAKELKKRGIHHADILLAVGLPLTRFGAEKQDFLAYLSKNKQVVYEFGGATVMKLFGNHSGTNIQYMEDVKANAKGYEYLGRLYLSTHRKEFGLE